MPAVSVVIRNRNEAALLEKALEALAAQRLRATEIILVDNCSSDNSRRVAESHGARIISIAKEEFTYGRALNAGISASSGELVLLLSAHSLPIGRYFLEQAIEPFSEPQIGATRCILVNKRQELERWVSPRVLNSPADLRSIILNGPIASGCVIRRSVWEQVHFDESLEAVEDKFWALETLRRGYWVAGCEAVYLHMRQRGLWERARIVNREQLAFYRATGSRWREPELTLPKLAKAVLLEAPYSAGRIIAKATLEYVYQKTIPIQTWRKPKVGSLQ